ncbi:transposase IS4 domain-containing protein [Phthorimaea operculella]|nr:transposase IS4 domain-containing protein [Phthorimaea operculella]
MANFRPHSSLKVVDISTLPRGEPLEKPLHPKKKRKWAPEDYGKNDERKADENIVMKNLNNRIKYSAPRCTVTGKLTIADISTLPRGRALETPLHPRKKRKWHPDYSSALHTVKKIEVKEERKMAVVLAQSPPPSTGSIMQSPRGRVRTRGGISQTPSPRKLIWNEGNEVDVNRLDVEDNDRQNLPNNASSTQSSTGSIMLSPRGRVRTRGGLSQSPSPRKLTWNEGNEVDVNGLHVDVEDSQNFPNNASSTQSSTGSITRSPLGRVRTRGGLTQTSSPRKPNCDADEWNKLDVTKLNVVTLDFLDAIVLGNQNEVVRLESIDTSNSPKPDDSSTLPTGCGEVIAEVGEENSSKQTLSLVESPNNMENTLLYDSESGTWVCANNPVEVIIQDDLMDVIGLNAVDAQEEQNGGPSNSPTDSVEVSERLECSKALRSILSKPSEKTPRKNLNISPITTESGDVLYTRSERCTPLKKRVRFKDCNENIKSTSTATPERPKRPLGRSRLGHPRGVSTSPKTPDSRFSDELIKFIKSNTSTPEKTPKQNPDVEKSERNPTSTNLKMLKKSARHVKLRNDGADSLPKPEERSTSSLLKTLAKVLRHANARGERPSNFRPRKLFCDQNEKTEKNIQSGEMGGKLCLIDSKRNAAVTEFGPMPKDDRCNFVTENRESISSTQKISPVQSPKSMDNILGFDRQSDTWITSSSMKSPHSEMKFKTTSSKNTSERKSANGEDPEIISQSSSLNKVVECPASAQFRDNAKNLPGDASKSPAQHRSDVNELISEECSAKPVLKSLAQFLQRARAIDGRSSCHLKSKDKIKNLKNNLINGESNDEFRSNGSERNNVSEFEKEPDNNGSKVSNEYEGSFRSTTSVLQVQSHNHNHLQTRKEIKGSIPQTTLNEENMENIHYGSEGEDSDDDAEELVPMIVPRAYRTAFDISFQDDENLDLPAPLPMDVGSPDVALSKDVDGALRPNDLFHFEWRSFPDPPIPANERREPFTQAVVGPTKPCQDPYINFVSIWDTEIMEHIVTETNKYAQGIILQRIHDNSLCPRSRILEWENTCVNELYTYFAIILATGIVVKSKLEEYWSASHDIFSTPGFRAQMSLSRFQLLTSCLHFNDNQEMRGWNLSPAEARLFKIEPILNHLNSKFQSMYTLSRNIAIDESLLQWKGWLSINQHISNKKAKTGVKTYEVCESQTGYLWRFEVHANKFTPNDQQSPLYASTPTIVLNLLRGLEGKGYTVWMDNYYNSPALARQLKILGFDVVGTLRTNRQFVPQELKNLTKSNMSKGQITGLTSGDVDLMRCTSPTPQPPFYSRVWLFHGASSGDLRPITDVGDDNLSS